MFHCSFFFFFFCCRIRTSRGLLLTSFSWHCVSEISSKLVWRWIYAARRASLSELLDTENGARKKKKNPTGGWKISSQLNLLHTSAFQSVTNPARVKTLPLSEPQLCFAGPTGLIRGISEPLGGSEAAFQGHWCRAPFVELDAVQIAPTQSSILYRKGEKRKEEVLSL